MYKLHQSHTTEGLQDLSDYSMSISVLLTPPKIEMQSWKAKRG